MNNYYGQRGVGLMEVLVALVILAIGVLGFSALQLKGIEAAQEANEQAVAINIARDLAERMRINRTALLHYKSSINDQIENEDNCTTINTVTSGSNKIQLPKCNAENMAHHDATEITKKAKSMGQTVVIDDCVKSGLSCIYVAWGTTSISSDSLDECINETTGAYIANSQCLVLEAY
ncbi:type IV pilus modification protein PilV [Acinetobacter indicus]|uniref:type IV pilus modification protein PilV n=1 Tax=Acinetobacter indicus TaxID=756892 RepID=UPI000CEC9493|nr:type IV pilus modification protein PilV [Acinetobacter indicus]MDM1276962.1 type IV pilus modification protein PilV [Acinetobacter indicus]